jgi:2'-5' RNA ligase
MQRLFIGIELSKQTKLLLNGLSVNLAGGIENAKWVRQENIHMTLKFLGNTPDEKTEAIKQVLQNVAARFRKFSFTLDEPGCFPREDRATVIWVGVRFGASELIELARVIDMVLADIGFKTEKRLFKPHVTLARIKTPTPVNNVFADTDVSEIIGHVVNVAALTVFKSTLSPKGAHYDVLARIPLSP